MGPIGKLASITTVTSTASSDGATAVVGTSAELAE